MADHAPEVHTTEGGLKWVWTCPPCGARSDRDYPSGQEAFAAGQAHARTA